MARKQLADPPMRGAPQYMTTFGDMMALFFTFFVLLVSMATFEPTKFKVASESLQDAFGILEAFPSIPIHPVHLILEDRL